MSISVHLTVAEAFPGVAVTPLGGVSVPAAKAAGTVVEQPGITTRGDALTLAFTLGTGLAETLADELGLADVEVPAEGLALPEALAPADELALADTLALLDGLALEEVLADGLVLAEALAAGEELELAEGLALELEDELADTLALDGLAETLALEDALAEALVDWAAAAGARADATKNVASKTLTTALTSPSPERAKILQSHPTIMLSPLACCDEHGRLARHKQACQPNGLRTPAGLVSPPRAGPPPRAGRPGP
ncbi:MAG TPA: hypothetical protein VF157_05320 [Chloroflexota bacterium]